MPPSTPRRVTSPHRAPTRRHHTAVVHTGAALAARHGPRSIIVGEPLCCRSRRRIGLTRTVSIGRS
ncbi:hypothetical protein SORBI_3005G110120 [Sorghum bicolor]|uniref:Uncharacterized protein n=1 Tax=Sorghum bicolor TaxID=4558 RepID=A0A1Z5RIS5_SORBI|nr:hypothetical protein SORBI_3005G110120 [Sorghum bicolor]